MKVLRLLAALLVALVSADLEILEEEELQADPVDYKEPYHKTKEVN